MGKNKNRPERLSELQKKSFEQLGIKDLMIILNHWQKAHKAERIYQGIN